MKRYSILYGTELDGNDTILGAAKQLDGFITRDLAAKSASLVKGTIKRKMMEFEPLAGYESEFNKNKPLAVRYSPVYLDGIEGLESIKAFSVLCVSGFEQRFGGRASSQFLMSTYFRTEELYKSDEYNYLDHIFGTRLMTAADERAFLENGKQIDFDAMPLKVVPDENACDIAVVMKAVDAIFNNQKVAILIEPDCSFQQRSLEILKLIYSYMPPILAAETGFSSYQNPKTLASVADINVMLFTIPKEQNLEGAKFPCIIDLTEKQAPIDTPIARAVKFWSVLPWAQRQAAMEGAFANTEQTYDDAELFATRTEEFFREYASFDTWLKSFDAATYSKKSLEELRQEIDSYGRWKRVSWAADTFYQMVSKASPKTLKTQTAEKYLTYFLSDETDENAKRLVAFGNNFGTPNLKALCTGLRDHVAGEKDKHYTEKMAAAEKHYQEVVRQNNETHQLEIQKKTQEYDELKTQCAAEITKVRTQCEAKIAEVNTKYETDTQTLKKEKEELATKARSIIAEKEKSIQQLSMDVQTARSNATTAENAKMQLESEARELKDKIRRLEESGYSIQEPENPMKKWIMMGIGLAAGLLLMGMIWLVVALVGGQASEETTVPTESIVESTETTVPTEATEATTEATEETTEATEETTVPTEPEPVAFAGWEDANLAYNMGISVEGVTCATQQEQWYTDKVTIPEGYEVLVAFTADENAGETYQYPATYSLVLRQSPVEENPEASTDATDATTTPGTSGGFPVENNEDPTEKPTTDEWIALAENVSLVMETEDYVIVTVGRDGANAETAFRAAQWFAGNTSVEASINYSPDETHMLDLNQWIDKLFAVTENDQVNADSNPAGRIVEELSTSDARMGEIGTVLNSSRNPVFVIGYEGNAVAFYNYSDEPAKATELETAWKDTYKTAVENDIVAIAIPNA